MGNRVSRRTVLRAGGTLSALSLAGCSSLAGLFGDDAPADAWPMFQFGPEHGGAHPTASGPGEDLEVRWETSATSIAAVLYDDVGITSVSEPVVADGSVYALLWVRGSDGIKPFSLVVLDGETGELDEAWELSGTNPITRDVLPRPAVVDGIVYVTTAPAFDSDPVLALDAETGEVVWRDDSDRFSLTEPTVRDGTVVVGAGEANTAYAVGGEGPPAWQYVDEVNDVSIQAASDAPPTVTADRVYVPSLANSTLYALDRDGNEAWSRDLYFENDVYEFVPRPHTPVAGDDLYVVTSDLENRGDGKLFALDPADGSTQWEFRPEFDPDRRATMIREIAETKGRRPALNVGVYGTPARWNGTLYVLGLAMPAERQPLSVPHLYAVDAESGEERWATQLPEQFGFTPPVVADGVVYVACGGVLLAIDGESGEIVEILDSGTAYRGLAIAGESIYASDTRALYGIGP